MRRRAAAGAALVGVVASAGLVACSGSGSGAAGGSEHERVAHELAEALETGETTYLWTGVDLAEHLTNLVDLPRRVAVTEVGEPHVLADDGPPVADVELEWAWDLDADGTDDWTYATKIGRAHV